MAVRGVTGADLVRASVRGRARTLIGCCAAAAVYQTGQVMIPILVGAIVDVAVGNGSASRLALGVAVLAVDFVALAVGWRISQRLSQHAATAAAHDVRMRLTERVLSARGGVGGGSLPGTLAALAIGDARRFGMINHAVPHLVASAAAVVVAGAAVLATSPPLGLLVLAGSPALLWVINRLGTSVERRSSAQQDAVASASGVAVDLLAGVRILKGLGVESAAVDRYRRSSRRSMTAAVAAGRVLGVFRGTVLAANGAFLAVVALVGAHLAGSGEITVGGFVAAVGLVRFLVGPLSAFGTMFSVLAQARASAARLADVLSSPPAVAAGSTALPGFRCRGGLRLRDVHHGHLVGVDLTIGPGTIVGVVVDRPAAADDLVDLLARHADAGSGSILLDDVDVTDLGPDVVRRSLLVAAHDAELFRGTVADNVVAGGTGSGVEAALTAARADQVCEALPQGSATPVGLRGRTLSGGQRQRIALARALARDTPVLVLHEPTTAVDTLTEAAIAAGVRTARTGRTTVVITASPALLAVTDRVVVVRDGRVATEGTHADLVADADYRELVLS